MTHEARVDTIHIASLRKFLKKNRTLIASIGQFAQLKVVIDANFVISDLAQKIRYPERGMTALEEMAKATILQVFAPRWLEADLASGVRKAAANLKLPEESFWAAWQDYQALITWDENWQTPPEFPSQVSDVKDLPYVLLEKLIGATGVLSNDKDISRMGGNRLTLDFVFATRSYARAVVISVGLRLSGIFVGALTLEALSQLLTVVGRLSGRLTSGQRVALLLLAVVVFLHPGMRKWIFEKLQALGSSFGDLLPSVSAVFTHVMMLEHDKRLESEAHLANVFRHDPQRGAED